MSTTADNLRQVLAERVAAAMARTPDTIAVPRERTGHDPLAPAERRMWLASQHDPTGYLYNVPVLVRLAGPLDVDALLAAVRDMVDRHEVLRRVVNVDSDGEPVARLCPATDVPIGVVSLDGGSLDELVSGEATRPFDLTKDCPLRVTVFRLAPDQHALLLVSHHIATDAWSQRLLVDGIAARYAAARGPALSSGEASGPQRSDVARGPVEASGLQRSDVARWELGRLAELNGALDWWRTALAGLPDALDLPTDRPRAAVPDPRAGSVAVTLPAEVSDRIRSFATGNGASVFMVLLAAWQALLGRLAAVTDLAVGVPFAGRRRSDVDSVLGCFVDTVVVRGDLSGEPTSRELLHRVREASLAAFAHAEAPYESVVEATRPARLPGVTPLFQTLLNVYERAEPPRFPGLRAEVEEVDLGHQGGGTKFDLTLTVVDSGPGTPLDARLDFRSALFNVDTATGIARWYGNLLRGMLADPDAPVDALVLDERTSTVTGPARTYPCDEPLHHLIARSIARCPQSTAVVAADGELTYAELDRRAAALADRLSAAGVTRGTIVAVLAARDTHLPVALLAILRAGGAYLPIDPDSPPARIEEILRVGGVRHVLRGPDFDYDTATATTQVDVEPTDLAYVIFTSGSTGQPKGVGVEHRSIVHYLHAVLERLDTPQAGSFALVSTPAADLGLTCLLGALVTGASLHLVDRETAVEPGPFGEYLRRHQIDVVKMVPSHLQMLARHGDLAEVLPRRLLILAGEACPWPLIERIRELRPDLTVQSHYGPTETTVAVAGCDPAAEPPEHRVGWLPIGRPFANAVLHVVDPAGRPVPVGAPGELVIGGPGVARGYIGRPDLTAERFGPDPVTGTGRCYRTGDRVRLRADGVLTFLGRVDDQVKVRGYRIELGEVAAACQTIPGVAQAVVLPVGDGLDRALAAWVVPADGAELDGPAIRRALRERLPEPMVPAGIAVLDRLPLGANGKVDRAALPDPVRSSTMDSSTVEPETDTERRVAAAWRAVLGAGSIGRDDDFFALGGDSVGAVRLARVLGGDLRAVDVLTHPTVRELAEFLDRRDAGGTQDLLHPLWTPVGRPRATVICVPYGGGSAAAYQPLAAALPDDVAVLAIELPGHDPARPDEPFLPLAECVERCAAEVRTRVAGPVLVYGHCVGTAAAVALAHRLEQDGREVAAVVLGAGFPAARLPGRLFTALGRILPTDRWQSDRALRELLRAMGGLPDGLDEAGAAAMTRALRHDAREAEAWFSRLLQDGLTPRLRAPILSVVGERDRATEFAPERCREWTVVADRVSLVSIPGAGHYFLKHQADLLAVAIAGQLSGQVEERPAAARVAPTTVPARRPLRKFGLVAGGQFMSMVGTQVSAFGLGVWTYQRTGRISDYAIITMLALVPAVLASPIGGALADRYDRRRVMLACDVLAGAAMAVLAALYWTDALRVWHVAVVVGFTSLIVAAQRPAYLAAVAQLVPKPYLPQANALAQLGTGVGALLAPFLGGGLIAVVGLEAVLVIDLVSFGIGVMTLLPIRIPPMAFRRREERIRSALAGGWRFIASRPAMRVMAGYFVPVNFLAAVTLALVAPLVLTYGSAASLGAVTAAGGLGAAAGGLLMVVWGGTQRRAIGMVAALLPAALGTLCLGLATTPVVAGAGLFVWWAATSVLNAHWLSILQLKAGTELLGRVLAVNQMLATAMMPLGFLAAPAAVAHIPAGHVLVGSGLLLALWAVLGLCYRPLRRLEDDLPDAVPGAVIPVALDDIQAEADSRIGAARGSRT